MALDTATAVAKLNVLTRKFDVGVEQAKPFWPTVCTDIPSSGASEDYGALGSVPKVREWLGDRVFGQLAAGRFNLPNRDWENSLAIPRNSIMDDKLGLYGPILQEMGMQAMQHPDELLFSAITLGKSTLCWDGQFFYDTDHSWGQSGTNNNDLTASAVSTSAPTAAEFSTSFDAALLAMYGFKRDNGAYYHQPVITDTDNLLVLVPTGMYKAAKTALEAIILAGTDNIKLANARVVSSPYLTTGTEWYLFKLGGVLRPFVFQRREPLTRQMKGMNDHEFKDVKFMTDARYTIGYLGWYNTVLTTFT